MIYVLVVVKTSLYVTDVSDTVGGGGNDVMSLYRWGADMGDNGLKIMRGKEKTKW
jgi:hypothetical protein